MHNTVTREQLAAYIANRNINPSVPNQYDFILYGALGRAPDNLNALEFNVYDSIITRWLRDYRDYLIAGGQQITEAALAKNVRQYIGTQQNNVIIAVRQELDNDRLALIGDILVEMQNMGIQFPRAWRGVDFIRDAIPKYIFDFDTCKNVFLGFANTHRLEMQKALRDKEYGKLLKTRIYDYVVMRL